MQSINMYNFIFFNKAVNVILLEKNIGEGHLALVSNGFLDMKSKAHTVGGQC